MMSSRLRTTGTTTVTSDPPLVPSARTVAPYAPLAAAIVDASPRVNAAGLGWINTAHQPTYGTANRRRS